MDLIFNFSALCVGEWNGFSHWEIRATTSLKTGYPLNACILANLVPTKKKKNLQIVVKTNLCFITLQRVWAPVDKADQIFQNLCSLPSKPQIMKYQWKPRPIFWCSWLFIKVRPVCFVLYAHPVWSAGVIPGCGVDCGMQDTVQDVGGWNWQTGISCPPWEDPGGPWAWARRRGTSVGMWPLTVKCQPPSLADTIRSNLNDWLFWSGENSTDIMWFWQSKPHWNLAFEYPRGWQPSRGLAGSPIEFTSNQLTAELDKLP